MKEYFRKPNVAKSYADMFERKSERQMQEETVYKHSEFKKPYESDSYDDMEQMASLSFNFPHNAPPGWDHPMDVIMINMWSIKKIHGPIKKIDGPIDQETPSTFSGNGTGPAKNKTCKELWDELFGNWNGNFIDSGSMTRLNQYAQKCPVLIVSFDCCKNTRITGDNVFENPIKSGCTYTWTQKLVSKVGTTCTYLLEAWTIWNRSEPCASKTITKKCGKVRAVDNKLFYTPVVCGGESIGYVSQQMGVNDIQSLTVVDPAAGATYTWEVTSGGGSITSDGVYTAPATNAGCANNPTISLKCGGNVMTTLKLAVNGSDTNCQKAATQYCVKYAARTPPWSCCQFFYGCKGVEVATGGCGGSNSSFCGPGYWDCVNYTATRMTINDLHDTEALALSSCSGHASGTYDTRTEANLLAGCCPQQLL